MHPGGETLTRDSSPGFGWRQGDRSWRNRVLWRRVPPLVPGQIAYMARQRGGGRTTPFHRQRAVPYSAALPSTLSNGIAQLGTRSAALVIPSLCRCFFHRKPRQTERHEARGCVLRIAAGVTMIVMGFRLPRILQVLLVSEIGRRGRRRPEARHAVDAMADRPRTL